MPFKLAYLWKERYPPQAPEPWWVSFLFVPLMFIVCLVVFPLALLIIAITKFYGLISGAFSGKSITPSPVVENNPKWEPFLKRPWLELECSEARMIPWDGPIYYLRSLPTLPFLQGKQFVAWSYIAFDGIFIEEFHDFMDCSLIYIDSTLTVTEVGRLPSRNWTISVHGDRYLLEASGVQAKVTYELEKLENDAIRIVQ